MTGTAFKFLLLTGIAATAIHGEKAFAQEVASKPDPSQADGSSSGESTIIVSGVRESLRSAAAQKRDASQVIDAITAEDIGKFPSENVADASQRITGVQITRTRGAGTGVSIRGLPTNFTLVELNGSPLASSIVDLRGGGAGGSISRSFDFRLLPTEFVSTLEVIKSPTADMEEGGLSGTVNVKTVRPLDLGKTTLVGSAFGVWNSNAGKVTPQASGLFSTTFGGSRVGFLVAGGYSQTKTETHNINNVGWSTTKESVLGQDLDSDGDKLDTFNIPSQVRTEIAPENRRRMVLTSTLEFKPTPSLRLYAEGFYSRFHVQVQSFENLFIFTGARGGVIDPSKTNFTAISGIDPSQLAYNVPFATTLGLQSTDVRANDRVNDSVAKTYYGKAGAELNSDHWVGGVSYIYSKSQQTGDNLNLAQIQRFDVTEICEPGQQLCGLDLTSASQQRYLDPQQGIVASLNGAFGVKTRDRLDEVKGDLGYRFDNSFLRRISFGGAASWRATYGDATTLVVPAATLATLVTLPRTTVQPSGFSLGKYYQVVTPSRGAFLGAYSGDLTFPTSWLATDTLALLRDIPRATLAAIPGAVQANLSSVVDVQERVLAGYVQADFGTGDDRLSGNVGVRVVKTQELANGVSPNLGGLVIQVETGGTVTVPPAGPITSRNSYTYALPSANLKFDLTHDVILRLAASRTMSRPTLTQISPSTTVTGAAGNYTITTGNPDLKPFLSTNYDLTVEWYPNRDTALTVAAFYKDVASLVYPSADQIILPVSFYTASTATTVVRDQVFQRNRPINGEGVKLKGFEIGYQQAFTFLPGPLKYTGAQINYTFISNSKPQILTAASKNNFNLSAYYDDGAFAARASYTWRDKFVSIGLPGGFNGIGVTTLPRGELDLNLTYNISRQLSVVFEGTNVLDNVDMTRSTLGGLPTDFYDTGHQYMLGARFKY